MSDGNTEGESENEASDEVTLAPSQLTVATTPGRMVAETGTTATPGRLGRIVHRVPLQNEASVTAAGSEPLPVVPSGVDPSSERLFEDRHRSAVRWYLPSCTATKPADGPLFRCSVQSGPGSGGERREVYHGRIEFDYAVDEEPTDAVETAWRSVTESVSDAELKPIALTIDRIELRLEYIGEDDTWQTESFAGTLHPEQGRVVFELKDDYLKMAYWNLAKDGDAQATLVFYAAFDGWQRSDEVRIDVAATPAVPNLLGPGSAAVVATKSAPSVDTPGPGSTPSTDGGTGPTRPLPLNNPVMTLPLSSGSGPTVASGRVGERTHAWGTLRFGASFSAPPVVLVDLETFNGTDPADVRLRNRTASGVEARVQEGRAGDAETSHVPEELAFLALPSGWVVGADGARIGEVGTYTTKQPDASTWFTVTLQRQYADPVVLAQLQTANGRHPAHVRLRNVGSGSFEFQIEEWEYLNDKHVEETVGYLIVEQGRHTLPDDSVMTVGTTRTGARWQQVSFDSPFGSPATVLSHCQTHNGGQAVVTRHRSVTDAGFEVRLQEEEQQAPKHVAETVGYVAIGEPAGPQYVRQSFVVEETDPLSFPCERHQRSYTVREDDSETSFGCSPPWAEDRTVGARYRPLRLADSPEGVTLFESTAEPNTFLLVPATYVVSRGDENGSPKLSVVNATDPEQPERSFVQLKAWVAPDLTDFDWRRLEQRLYDYTQTVNGEPRRPRIVVPAAGTGVTGTARLDLPVDHRQPVAAGREYMFSVRFDSFDDAAVAIDQLTAENTAVTGRLRFEAAAVTDESLIRLDLNRTIGPVLDARYDPAAGTVRITNVCESPVTVHRLGFYTDGRPGFETRSVDDVGPIAAGTEVTYDVTPVDGSYDSVVADYTVDEDTSKALSERMIELDLLTLKLGVTSNLNPKRRGITALRVELKFPTAGQRETCVLGTRGDGFETSVVEFNLPLGTYLDPAARTVEYRPTITYADGTEETLDWVTYDVGKTAILNITADDVGLPDVRGG